jgi:glycosyltransferase involved in cell wall biosynthesis
MNTTTLTLADDGHTVPTVTIGIPAYNEAVNIGRLLTTLLNQRTEGFVMTEIVVVSDGSTDGTERIVRKMAMLEDRIKLLADGKRKGKATRMNEISERTKTDILVLLDADICFSHGFVISELVYPLIEDETIMHTSGHALPLYPWTDVEKIAYAGAMAWERARQMTPSKLYFSEGRIRAFRRTMYQKLRFPLTSADEAYSFLFGEKMGYRFSVVERAQVRYQLPRRSGEYIKQMKRFLASEDIQGENFDPEFVAKYYTMRWGVKFRAFVAELYQRPFWGVCYLLTLPWPRISRFLDRNDHNGVWAPIASTKGLHL